MTHEDHLLCMINNGPLEGAFTFDQKYAVVAGLDALIRVKEIVEAVDKFIEKLDRVNASDAMKSVYTVAAIHHCPYTGESYKEELDALKEVLKDVRQDISN